MSNGNGNHKARPYHFPAPLLIKSDSPITVTDGKATLVHEGSIILRILDGYLVELQPQEKSPENQTEGVQTVLIPETYTSGFVLPPDYDLLVTSKAGRRSHATEKSDYLYYKRTKDESYLVAITQGKKIIRHYDLGSLFDANSRITIALKAFTREKPFYRRDLKAHLMPPSIKHGQLIKSCLDILVKEGFLSVQNIRVAGREMERYTRTSKMLP